MGTKLCFKKHILHDTLLWLSKNGLDSFPYAGASDNATFTEIPYPPPFFYPMVTAELLSVEGVVCFQRESYVKVA